MATSPAAGWWKAAGGALTISVRVLPGAPRSEVAGASAGALKVRVAAPAHEGKANAELRRFLARAAGVRASAVTITRGEHARDKVVRITGLDELPAGLDPAR